MDPEIEAFFFKGMWARYIHNFPPVRVVGMSGYKQIELQENDLRFLDQWCELPGGHSAGTITIWNKNQIVWIMQYDGLCREENRQFLKDALRVAYLTGTFFGGRGPLTFTPGGFAYTNRVLGTFPEFSGREEILDTEEGILLGYHNYRGRRVW